MNLGVADHSPNGKNIIAAIQEIASQEPHLSRWFEHPASEIIHHDDSCCEEARLWFLSYARSMEIGSLNQFRLKTPSWLCQHYTWGPSRWPIFWCELVKQDMIDCGVFAALAREIFTAQGHKVYPAQALLSYTRNCTQHWRGQWNETWVEQSDDVGEAFPWVGNVLVYHELVVLEMDDGTAKFYDPTNAVWYDPHQRLGFASIIAVKSQCPRVLSWGGKEIVCGEWVSL